MPCSYRGHIACVNEAVRIPRYRGLQGSAVTILIRCPIVFILLTGSFVDVAKMRVKNIVIYEAICDGCLSA
jgi:hypothetical protein